MLEQALELEGTGDLGNSDIYYGRSSIEPGEWYKTEENCYLSLRPLHDTTTITTRPDQTKQTE